MYFSVEKEHQHWQITMGKSAHNSSTNVCVCLRGVYLRTVRSIYFGQTTAFEICFHCFLNQANAPYFLRISNMSVSPIVLAKREKNGERKINGAMRYD